MAKSVRAHGKRRPPIKQGQCWEGVQVLVVRLGWRTRGEGGKKRGMQGWSGRVVLGQKGP